MKINIKYRLLCLLGALFLLLPLPLQAAAPADGIDDRASLFSPGERESLGAVLKEMERDAGFPFFIIALKDPGRTDLEAWAERLRRDWNITDRPALIMILLAPDQRRARIDIYGAARHVVSDDQARRILETQLLPAFAEGDYSGGLRDGLSALAGVIGKDSLAGYSGFIPFLILGAFALFYVVQRRRHRRRRENRMNAPATAGAAGGDSGRENAEADPREREQREGNDGGAGGASGSW